MALPLVRFSARSKTGIEVERHLRRLKVELPRRLEFDTPQGVAATVAAELCRKLYAGGVKQFHFYTLNRAELSFAICHLLGLRARPEVARVAA